MVTSRASSSAGSRPPFTGLAGSRRTSTSYTNEVTRTSSGLVGALAPHNPYLRGTPPGLPFEWSADTIREGLNFTLTTAVGDIDILGEIVGGGSYDDLLPHTTTVELFARPHRCLDLPWLIHVKRAGGRPKDLEVIAELEALLEERGDA